MSVQAGHTDALKESEVFHILGNDRRRAIVQLLAVETGRIGISEIASEIASEETETRPVPNNRYKSVYVSLQQTHLPQLEEDGVIEYDSNAKMIEPGQNFDDVLQYIDGEDENHEFVLTAHLTLAVLGLAIVILVGVNVPAVSSLDPVWVNVLLFLVIAASSIYYLLR